jgi:predicted phosphodiesterase
VKNMPPPLIMASVIFIIALAAGVANYRFLMYPLIPSLNPATHANKLRLKGTTLFISDLHLKSNRPFNYAADLRRFVETNNVSNLVVNGDLFDSPRDAREILSSQRSENGALMKLGLEGLSMNSFWVLGSPPHDPAEPSPNLGDSLALQVLGRCVLIDCGILQVIAYHGHDLSHVGAMGHAWDRFVSRLSLERLWKKLAKIDRSIWVIFGHTHIPGVDAEYRVANCGGWQTVPFVSPTKTGILISEHEDVPKLVQIA